jgi:hypothetical protein
MDIADVRRAFIENKFRYTKHGTEQRINRHITGEDIKQAILTGEIIENYPTDKYGPSYLVYGKTDMGRPLHVQIALLPIISIVTVYEPYPEQWIDNRIRRK